MQILSINQQANNNSFQAVSQKYLQRAEKEFKQIKGISGDLLDCLYYDTFYKQLSKQDAIDTLNAIKPYVTGAKDFYEHIYQIITKLSQ